MSWSATNQQETIAPQVVGDATGESFSPCQDSVFNHEALISLETFEKIQRLRQGNHHLPLRKNIGRDFVLRGAVCCHSCRVPLRSCWTKGNTKTYPYYFCQTKGCIEYGKSIARDKVEGAFEALLQEVEPPQRVVALTKAMFKQAWEAQAAGAKAAVESCRRKRKSNS